MGTLEVTGELWGAETQRAILNFGAPSRYRWRSEVIRALGVVKKCSAQANGELGMLPALTVVRIVRAAEEVIEGRWDDEFPIGLSQSGSGTQTNMNANEVIARRATLLATPDDARPIDAHDDVNRSQSSNDVFSSVMHLATVEALHRRLLPVLARMADLLQSLSASWKSVIIIGRTHLQDAVPLTLGQVVSGWLAQVQGGLESLDRQLPPLLELSLGATAVGTGLNAPPEFGDLAIRKIAEETGRPFRPSRNRFAALSAHEALASCSGALRTLASSLFKIANDVRWYASGPRAGLGEFLLPASQPGSSIMPGKTNPVHCESLMMAALLVFGHDQALSIANSQGNFQLNTCKPLILHLALESVHLLAEATAQFADHCLRRLQINESRIQDHVQRSLMLGTALSPHLGYDKVADITLRADRGQLTLREAALQSGLVTADQFDEWTRPEALIDPGGGPPR